MTDPSQNPGSKWKVFIRWVFVSIKEVGEEVDDKKFERSRALARSGYVLLRNLGNFTLQDPDESICIGNTIEVDVWKPTTTVFERQARVFVDHLLQPLCLGEKVPTCADVVR